MKVTTKLYIHFIKYPWETEGKYVPFSMRLDDDDTRVFINEQEVEIEVPDSFDPRPAQIAALEAKKQKAIADFQHTVDMINEQISKLQAIEFQP